MLSCFAQPALMRVWFDGATVREQWRPAPEPFTTYRRPLIGRYVFDGVTLRFHPKPPPPRLCIEGAPSMKRNAFST